MIGSPSCPRSNRFVGGRRYGAAMEFLPMLIVAALWARWGLVLIATVVGAYALHRVVREFGANNTDTVQPRSSSSASSARQRRDGTGAFTPSMRMITLTAEAQG